MNGKANQAIMVRCILVAICGHLLGQAPATTDAAPGSCTEVATAPAPPPSAPSASQAKRLAGT